MILNFSNQSSLLFYYFKILTIKKTKICLLWLVKDWFIIFYQFYIEVKKNRESNFFANFLAKLGGSYPLNLHVLSLPPEGIGHIIQNDSCGVSFIGNILVI